MERARPLAGVGGGVGDLLGTHWVGVRVRVTVRIRVRAIDFDVRGLV